MKRNLYIFLIVFTLIYVRVGAQTAYFALVPGSLSTQIKGTANDSLSLFYKVTYVGDFSSPYFNGIIYTRFVTNNDSVPGTATDGFNTAAQVPPLTINSGDTIGIYCHIIVKHPYFNNGKGNLVIIWPNGGRSVHSYPHVSFKSSLLPMTLSNINNLTIGSSWTVSQTTHISIMERETLW